MLINHDYISNKKQNSGEGRIFVIIEKEWNIESSSRIKERRTDEFIKAV